MRRRSTGWLTSLGAAVVVVLSLVVAPSAKAATPDPVTHLIAESASHQASLRWRTRSNAVDNVLVRRVTGSTPPTHTSDGVQVYLGTGGQVVDTGLSNGKTYTYSVWVISGGTESVALTTHVRPRRAPDVSLQLAASSRLIPYGRALTLSATLLDSSTSSPVPGETLQLQVRADSSDSWQVATDGVSNSAGRVTWKLKPQRTNQYRAVHQANPSYGAARTRAVTVTVKPALQANLGKSWARLSGTALIHGRVRPAFAREQVVLERRIDGHWATMKRTKQDDDGKYRFRVRGWAQRGTFSYRVAIGATSSHRAVHSATLRLDVVRLVTYRIETRGKIVASVSDFAKRATEIYADPRGWSRAFVHFKQVKGSSDFSLVLSQAKYVPTFASICDRYWSCRVGRYVIINQNRWRWGTRYFKHSGGTMSQYRAMVIDHETGHWFGLGHATCPGKGRRAPVMMQQSKGLHGCSVNSWPLPGEVARVR